MINKEVLEKTAKLSRLELSKEDEKRLLSEMGQILEYFEELKKIDTTDIEPIYSAVEMENLWRKDQVVESDSKKLMEVLHEQQEGQLKVPQVVK